MKKFSKRVRAEAAFLCDLAASSKWHYDDRGLDDFPSSYKWEDGPNYTAVQRRAGFSEKAWELAIAAWSTARDKLWTRAVDAEAAQLIRDGFTPS